MKLRKLIFVSILAVAVTVGCKEKCESGGGNGGGGGTTVITDKRDTLINTSVFDLLNLDMAGMEKVKSYYTQKQYYKAAEALLNYYRLRSSVSHPEVSLVSVTLTGSETQMAADALEYKFFSLTGFASYCYLVNGSIDWTYWPVQDNELRWQLHRHKWFVPLAKAYRSTGDEKYFKAWKEQYSDWMAKNPVPPVKISYGDPTMYHDSYMNYRFTWRPLEVSFRVLNSCQLLFYFINSQNFTPEWLCVFLADVHRHVNHIINNYTDEGNHLITEGQAVTYAACIFPEFKEADGWMTSGSGVLNTQIKAQFLDDGMLAELDFGYHLGAIDDFYKTLLMARANSRESQLSIDYVESMCKMIEIPKYQMFPDYSVPQFNDTRKASYTKSVMKRNFRKYMELFPDDRELEWLAYEGSSGVKPTLLTKAFTSSGYYVMRSGWDTSSVMMVLENGPAGSFHSQPDNGTFELYSAGRNFFPDSGVYKYSGDAATNAERAWFRQTRVHNTLTLNHTNITRRNGKCLLFKTEGNTDILVTENQCYSALKHRRAVFFVDKRFFVLIDEAYGNAEGTVNLNFNMCEGDQAILDIVSNGAHTAFADGNNMLVRTFSDGEISSTAMAGRVSYVINSYLDRSGCWSVNMAKTAVQTPRFITVLLPVNGATSSVGVSAAFTDSGYSASGAKARVTVDSTVYDLEFSL